MIKTKEERLILTIAVALSAVVLFITSLPLLASDYGRCCNDTYVTEEYITNEYYETTEVTNVTEVTNNETNITNLVNTDTLSRLGAISGAFAAMTSPSHQPGNHGHTAALWAVGSSHDKRGVGFGIEHQEGNKTFRGVLGLSGSESIIGVGGSISF